MSRISETIDAKIEEIDNQISELIAIKEELLDSKMGYYIGFIDYSDGDQTIVLLDYISARTAKKWVLENEEDDTPCRFIEVDEDKYKEYVTIYNAEEIINLFDSIDYCGKIARAKEINDCVLFLEEEIKRLRDSLNIKGGQYLVER